MSFLHECTDKPLNVSAVMRSSDGTKFQVDTIFSTGLFECIRMEAGTVIHMDFVRQPSCFYLPLFASSQASFCNIAWETYKTTEISGGASSER